MKSDNRDDYQCIDRPIGAMAKRFRIDAVVPPHSHERAQLLFAVSGGMEVRASGKVWIVTPSSSVWIPAGVTHAMRTRGGAEVRTIFVRPDACPPDASPEPCLLEVSPLLRELLVAATELPIDYDEGGRDGLLMDLLIKSIAWSAETRLTVRTPEDARLRRLFEALMADPSDETTLEDWGRKLGASARTLSRLVKSETGTTFVRWRQQLRLVSALPRLGGGEPVSSVAYALGYDSPGAFSTMFHRLLGCSPSRYAGRQRPGENLHRPSGAGRRSGGVPARVMAGPRHGPAPSSRAGHIPLPEG